MTLTAKQVPFSSVVGSSVTLHENGGRVVAQLAILLAGGKEEQVKIAEFVTAAINSSGRGKSPGWDDPLESPQAQAIREGKVDDTQIRDLFDKMERELIEHRKVARYVPHSEHVPLPKVMPGQEVNFNLDEMKRSSEEETA